MKNRTNIIAGALSLACLTLAGCVSEPGPYRGYHPAFDRDHDGPDRYWRNHRGWDRDHHDRGSRDHRSDRDDRGRNQAAYQRDKPDPTWAGRGSRGRDNDRDRGGSRSGGGHDILIPNQ